MYFITYRTEGKKNASTGTTGAGVGWREHTTPTCQSTSVWSRGRYLIPWASSSCSTSSGMRPFTVMAYTPRTYLSSSGSLASGKEWIMKDSRRTCSLPARHPALLRICDCNGPVKMRRCTSLNAIWRAFHLFEEGQKKHVNMVPHGISSRPYLRDILAVRTPVAPKVDGCLYDGTEKTCA